MNLLEDGGIAEVGVEADLAELILERIHVFLERSIGVDIGVGKTWTVGTIDDESVTLVDHTGKLIDGEGAGVVFVVFILMQYQQLDEGFEQLGADDAATRIAFGAAIGEEHGVGVFHAAVVDE